MACKKNSIIAVLKILESNTDEQHPIVKTPKGFYLSMKKFSLEEAEFIQKAILAANGKSGEEKSELAERLQKILYRIYLREYKEEL